MSETAEKTESTALAVIPATALPTIVANDKDDILGQIARKVAAFKPDISTESGRGEMRSLAYEVRRSKAELIRIGKSLTEGWRKSTKAVNEECGIIEERMDALAEKVRAPLTEWETAEKTRVKAHEDMLAALHDTATVRPGETPAQIHDRINALDVYKSRDWQEFRDRYFEARAACEEHLGFTLVAAEKTEADARELERLRAEEAERQRQEQERLQREREERIAAEAAEKARLAAERIAAEQAAAAERDARKERERIEAAAVLEAEAAARREREAQERAEAAERARVAAEAKAKADAEEAARKAEAAKVAAAQEAERREREAVEAEKRRASEAAAKEHAERQKREANKAHRTKINREALAALILLNLTEEHGIAVITAIAKKDVPHVSISY